MIPRLALAVTLMLGVASTAGAQPSVLADTAWIHTTDTRLFLELRGQASQGPILLFLHGGPGNAFGLVAFRAYAGPALEARALVGYLHQRGVIRSPAVPESSLTVANHVRDVVATIDYLAHRFPARPIVLVGHSWGGLLAALVALEGPRALAGVVNAAGPFDIPATMRASFDETLAWAKAAARPDVVQALEALGPPPYDRMEQQVELSKHASSGNGGIGGRIQPTVLLGREPFRQIDPTWSDQQLAIAGAMLRELYQIETASRLGAVRVPLLVLAGRRDLITPASSIQGGYAAWGGAKRWVELADSHHLVFIDETDEFVRAILEFVDWVREVSGVLAGLP